MLKKAFLILFLVFLIIQFFRPVKNISAREQPQALQKRYMLPAHVESTLKKACYDCHSNNTRYPWYAEVQPMAWYLAVHVQDGKEELNFDEFLSYPLKKQDHKLKEVMETQQEGEMPLASYTLLHRDARLTQEQRKEIVYWATQVRKQVNYTAKK